MINAIPGRPDVRYFAESVQFLEDEEYILKLEYILTMSIVRYFCPKCPILLKKMSDISEENVRYYCPTNQEYILTICLLSDDQCNSWKTGCPLLRRN